MRIHTNRLRAGAIALGALLMLGGCATSAQQMQNPNPPVPAMPADQPGLPPVSERPLIWQPGHWNWDGAHYVFAPGAWVERAGHGTLWQDGYWAHTADGWAWVPAHWM